MPKNGLLLVQILYTYLYSHTMPFFFATVRPFRFYFSQKKYSKNTRGRKSAKPKNKKTEKQKNRKTQKKQADGFSDGLETKTQTEKRADNNPSYSLAENSNQITNESEPPRSGGKGLEFPSRHGSKTDIQAAPIGVSASCWCADNGHADKHRGGYSPLPEHQQQGNGILLGMKPPITWSKCNNLNKGRK